MRRLRSFWLLLLLLAFPVSARHAGAHARSAHHSGRKGKLVLHFFDVGQGDSYLLVSPTGKTVLIDAGVPDEGPHVAARLKALVHHPLDLVILTHPHLDHLGGMADAIRAVGARRYMDDGFPHPSRSYTKLLKLVAAKVPVRVTPTVDPAHPHDLIHINLGGGADLAILWPRRPVEPFLQGTRSDPNANSIVAKLTYGHTAFLLMGDAEPDTEQYLLQKNINFRSTVLKVGHHGSRHSSTMPFLEKVRPKIALISCGLHNDYGHPGKATLDRLTKIGARIYRTDLDGEVTVVSDGETVTARAEKVQTQLFRVRGTIVRPTQLGPILPGVRKPSEATLEDRRRYGHHRRKSRKRSRADRSDDSTTPALPPLPPPAPIPPPPPAEALIPASVKARYPTGAAPDEAPRMLYVASKHSDVFHRADCKAVERIKPKNRVFFRTRAAAAAHHRPAQDCNP